MFPKEIIFNVYEQKNIHAKHGVKWEMKIHFDNDYGWVVKTWDKKPNEEAIQLTKEVCLRVMGAFSSNIKLPKFCPKYVETMNI